jgi:hypothetical protein
VGGFYTLVVLALGCAAGYFVGSRRVDEVAESVRRRMQPAPHPQSGSVKPYTPEEKAALGSASVRRMGEIIDGFHNEP